MLIKEILSILFLVFLYTEDFTFFLLSTIFILQKEIDYGCPSWLDRHKSSEFSIAQLMYTYGSWTRHVLDNFANFFIWPALNSKSMFGLTKNGTVNLEVTSSKDRLALVSKWHLFAGGECSIASNALGYPEKNAVTLPIH